MRYKMQKLMNFFIISRNIFFFVRLRNCFFFFAVTFTNNISPTEKHLREENTLTPRNLEEMSLQSGMSHTRYCPFHKKLEINAKLSNAKKKGKTRKKKEEMELFKINLLKKKLIY